MDESEAAVIVRDACDRYGRDEAGSLLNILSDIVDHIGYLPEAALGIVSEKTGVLPAVIRLIIDRSDMYSTIPSGRHTVTICDGTVCHASGSGKMANAVSAALGIAPGETTPDGRFSLKVVGCVGSCSHAPVMMIDGMPSERTKLSDIATILRRYD